MTVGLSSRSLWLWLVLGASPAFAACQEPGAAANQAQAQANAAGEEEEEQLAEPTPSEADGDGSWFNPEALAASTPRWPRSANAPRPDLARITTDGKRVFAPAERGATAELTLDPDVQRAALKAMRHYEIPEASVVMIDTQSGRVIAYANHLQGKPTRDLASLAEAPSASVFKVITSAALIGETRHAAADRFCYSGGSQRLLERDLIADEKRDRDCVTLAGALGRSINTVFARLASADLPPTKLEHTARALQYGSVLPFDVPVAISQIKLPKDTLGYARTAAGFWNTSLSPVHAAWISATIARGGVGVRPRIVAAARNADGEEVFRAPSVPQTMQALDKKTAQTVGEMMRATLTGGTATRAFRDNDGREFLPKLRVAGKTGTLTDAAKGRFYTWFTGFTPVVEGGPNSVAIAALVVNGPVWRVKANVLAREVLRAYYAKQGVSGVQAPTYSSESVAKAGSSDGRARSGGKDDGQKAKSGDAGKSSKGSSTKR